MRVLLVEDDDLFGSAVKKALTKVGYAIDWITKGEDLAASMAMHSYDCVLLDLGLPGIGGEALLQGIRSSDPGISVIVMTARGGIQDRVRLLDIGADDYLIKPVDLQELAARLRAITRRSTVGDTNQGQLEHGPLVLLPSRRAVHLHGKPVALTNKEYWLLETFVRRKNQILSRAQLEEALYGWGEEIGSNAVEVYIHYLRRKFGSNLIVTLRGVGYQLCSPNELL
jgi:DNA-binding response OmpR family regulator